MSNVGCSRRTNNRASAITGRAAGVGSQRVAGDTLQTGERSVDLCFRPSVSNQTICCVQTTLRRGESLLGEGVHHVVNVIHWHADFLHQRTSACNVRPSSYSRAGSANRQVAVLVHVLGKIHFEVSDDTGRHRLQDFIKLIQFQSFFNVAPFGSYSEILLNSTSCLTSNDIALGGQGNVTACGTDGVVIMRTLEVHIGAAGGVELVGEELSINRFGQNPACFKGVQEYSGDLSCNVTI